MLKPQTYGDGTNMVVQEFEMDRLAAEALLFNLRRAALPLIDVEEFKIPARSVRSSRPAPAWRTEHPIRRSASGTRQRDLLETL